LAALITENNDRAAAAALAINATAFNGGRRLELPMDLAVLAQRAITRLADFSRKRPDLSRLSSVEASKFELDKASAKAREAGAESAALAFGLAADSIRAALTALSRRQTTAMTA